MNHERERLEAKLKTLEPGSVEHNLFREILSDLDKPKVKLHVAEEQTCDGCA